MGNLLIVSEQWGPELVALGTRCQFYLTSRLRLLIVKSTRRDSIIPLYAMLIMCWVHASGMHVYMPVQACQCGSGVFGKLGV